MVLHLCPRRSSPHRDKSPYRGDSREGRLEEGGRGGRPPPGDPPCLAGSRPLCWSAMAVARESRLRRYAKVAAARDDSCSARRAAASAVAAASMAADAAANASPYAAHAVAACAAVDVASLPASAASETPFAMASTMAARRTAASRSGLFVRMNLRFLTAVCAKPRRSARLSDGDREGVSGAEAAAPPPPPALDTATATLGTCPAAGAPVMSAPVL